MHSGIQRPEQSKSHGTPNLSETMAKKEEKNQHQRRHVIVNPHEKESIIWPVEKDYTQGGILAALALHPKSPLYS